jgi:EAL domain-containing protein (putative c-di-GMP-specific phosphodiesterase class I)
MGAILRGMESPTLRLLGCAFAAADFLFEIDADHRVSFAVGAGVGVIGVAGGDARGLDWRTWVAEADKEMAEALCADLAPGERRGPVVVGLAAGRDRCATLTAFALPELHPAVSCSLTLGGARLPAGEAEGGLHDGVGFEALATRLAAAARRDGLELNLSLLEMPKGQMADAGPEALKKLAGLLRSESVGGASAARLGPDRFALLTPKSSTPSRLEARVERATGLDPVNLALPLNPDWNAEVFLRTLRFTLNEFIREGLGDDPAGALAEFEARAAATDARAKAFMRRVSNNDFELHFQPIVDLATGELDHYEALVRFDADTSPAELIEFAEELELMEPFDLAVVQSAIARLKGPDASGVKAAVNLSARSLLSDTFMDHFIDRLARSPELRGRLEFEITESAHLDDLQKADVQIQRLRRAGFKVALDDFGAGATSLAYLQALHVDTVKIDGKYIRALADGGRSITLVRHLVQLCRELGVATVAEMVENTATAELLRGFGVDMAQGYLFGRPTPSPRPPAPRDGKAARRVGAVETWG